MFNKFYSRKKYIWVYFQIIFMLVIPPTDIWFQNLFGDVFSNLKFITFVKWLLLLWESIIICHSMYYIVQFDTTTVGCGRSCRMYWDIAVIARVKLTINLKTLIKYWLAVFKLYGDYLKIIVFVKKKTKNGFCEW